MPNSLTSSVRLFMVAAGTMAREHVRAAQSAELDLEIHAADPDPSAREQFRSEFPAANLYDSATTMLALAPGNTDLVVIATPPWLHESYLELALRSGRDVLCEKPLLTSREAVDSVKKTLQETGRSLVCCSGRFVANPASQKVAESVQAGKFGQIYSVKLRQCMPRMRSGIEWQPESPWFMDRSRNGGGCLMDWAPYDLANLDLVLRPRAVTALHVELAQPELPSDLAETAVFDVETHAQSTLLYHLSDGSTVPVYYERASGSYEPACDEAIITGTRGSASWTSMGYAATLELSFRSAANERGAVQSFGPPGPLWYSRAPIRETLCHLRGRPHCAITGGDALFGAALLRALYECADSGQPVRVEHAAFSELPGTQQR